MRRFLLFLFSGILVTHITFNYVNSNQTLPENINDYFLSIFLSIIFYFVSVLIRSVRIFYISDKSSLSLKKLFSLQLQSTALQLLLPFRFGDFTRIYLFKRYLNSIAESALVFVTEKFFDMIATLTIILIWLIPNETSILSIASYKIFILISIVLSALIVFPYLLELFYKDILIKPDGKLKMSFIKSFSPIFLAKKKVIHNLKGKIINTLLISYIVWIFDSLSFVFIMRILQTSWYSSLVAGPMVALSSFLPSPPLGISGSVTIGLYWSGLFTGIKNLTDYSYTYSILIYGSFVIIVGLVTLLSFLNKKWGFKLIKNYTNY